MTRELTVRSIQLPLTEEDVLSLKAGDPVLLTGTIYAARDEAHENMIAMLERGEELPFPLENATIYYVGPAPARPGQVIGSAGPTTSGRMDVFTPPLIERGLRGMIGKGERDDAVIASIKEHKAVYFGAVGGAGALLAKCITSQKVIAWPELGPEALRELTVADMPLIVVIDAEGRDLYRGH